MEDFDITKHKFSDGDIALRCADDKDITLEIDTAFDDIILSKNDVMAMAKHFDDGKLTDRERFIISIYMKTDPDFRDADEMLSYSDDTNLTQEETLVCNFEALQDMVKARLENANGH